MFWHSQSIAKVKPEVSTTKICLHSVAVVQETKSLNVQRYKNWIGPAMELRSPLKLEWNFYHRGVLIIQEEHSTPKRQGLMRGGQRTNGLVSEEWVEWFVVGQSSNSISTYRTKVQYPLLLLKAPVSFSWSSRDPGYLDLLTVLICLNSYLRIVQLYYYLSLCRNGLARHCNSILSLPWLWSNPYCVGKSP